MCSECKNNFDVKCSLLIQIQHFEANNFFLTLGTPSTLKGICKASKVTLGLPPNIVD